MSFRELRNFVESMRILGYPHLISMESFRTPNFPLMADSLSWLLKRYDSSVDLSGGKYGTEESRIAFVKNAAQLAATKMRVKLNTRKLYGSDGYAVRELLKVTSLLQEASRATTAAAKAASDSGASGPLRAASATALKSFDSRQFRSLGSEVSSHGAALFSLLGAERTNEEARVRALAKPVEFGELERYIRKVISTAKEGLTSLRSQLTSSQSDEETLQAKIEKKKSEWERLQKRLSNLTTVRPAFMDEYEKYEAEVREVYREFVEKYRNLDHLQSLMERQNVLERSRREKEEQQLAVLRRKIQEEEITMLRGDETVFGGDGVGREVVDSEGQNRLDMGGENEEVNAHRQRKGGRGESVGESGVVVQGSLYAGESDSSGSAVSFPEDNDTASNSSGEVERVPAEGERPLAARGGRPSGAAERGGNQAAEEDLSRVVPARSAAVGISDDEGEDEEEEEGGADGIQEDNADDSINAF